MKKKKGFAMKGLYKLFICLSIFTSLFCISLYSVSADCINISSSLKKAEFTTYNIGDNASSKGFFKFEWNITGMNIDYTTITGYMNGYLEANDFPVGQGIRTGLINNDAVDMASLTAGQINALASVGNQSTNIGGLGAGIWVKLNMTNALRQMTKSNKNLSILLTNPDFSGEPTTKYDATGSGVFLVGKTGSEDAQIGSSSDANPYHLYICYNTVSALTNSSWNGTTINIIESSGKEWNFGRSINITSNLLSFLVNTSESSNMSCSKHNVNYTRMVSLNANYKAATTNTKEHSYTFFDNFSLGSQCMYCSFIKVDGTGELLNSSSGCLNVTLKDLLAPNCNNMRLISPIPSTTGNFSANLTDNLGLLWGIFYSNISGTENKTLTGLAQIIYSNITFSSENQSILWGFNFSDIAGNMGNCIRIDNISTLPSSASTEAFLEFASCPNTNQKITIFIIFFVVGIVIFLLGLAYDTGTAFILGSFMLFFWSISMAFCHYIMGFILMSFFLLMIIRGAGMLLTGRW